jgi:hypothetical protein
MSSHTLMEPTHPGGSLAPRPALGRLLAFVTSNCTLPLMQWGPHEVLYASCTWAPAGRGGGGGGGARSVQHDGAMREFGYIRGGECC